jgi:hypothetical protein
MRRDRAVSAGGEDNWAELRKQPSVVAEIGPQDMLRFPIRIKAQQNMIIETWQGSSNKR